MCRCLPFFSKIFVHNFHKLISIPKIPNFPGSVHYVNLCNVTSQRIKNEKCKETMNHQSWHILWSNYSYLYYVEFVLPDLGFGIIYGPCTNGNWDWRVGITLDLSNNIELLSSLLLLWIDFPELLFVLSAALQGEVEHAGDLRDEPVAGRAAEGHGRLGRRRPSFGRFPSLRGSRRGRHHERQRSCQVRHVGTSRRRGGFRLGLLREQSAYPLLRQIRSVYI